MPTAMQASRVGHEMPLSCGVVPPVTCCGSQVVPPFLVATMTVAPPGAGLGPATPTAQQWRASAHDDGPELARAGGCRLADGERGPLGLTEDARRRGRARVPGQRTARRAERHRSEEEDQAVAACGHPCVEARRVEPRQDDNSCGGCIFGCTVGYPRSGGLGRPADHRLHAPGGSPGAPARGHRAAPHLRRVHPRVPSRDPRVAAAAADGSTRRPHPLGRRRDPRDRVGVPLRLRRADPRHVEQRHCATTPPGAGRRRPRGRRGRHCGAAVGVAGGRGDHVAQQPLHLTRCGRQPLGHLAHHRHDPSPGALDLQRPADVLEQPGLPTGLLDLDPAVDAARSRRRATHRRVRWPTPRSSQRSRCWARRATTSRRARASSSAPDWWPRTRT